MGFLFFFVIKNWKFDFCKAFEYINISAKDWCCIGSYHRFHSMFFLNDESRFYFTTYYNFIQFEPLYSKSFLLTCTDVRTQGTFFWVVNIIFYVGLGLYWYFPNLKFFWFLNPILIFVALQHSFSPEWIENIAANIFKLSSPYLSPSSCIRCETT